MKVSSPIIKIVTICIFSLYIPYILDKASLLGYFFKADRINTV